MAVGGAIAPVLFPTDFSSSEPTSDEVDDLLLVREFLLLVAGENFAFPATLSSPVPTSDDDDEKVDPPIDNLSLANSIPSWRCFDAFLSKVAGLTNVVTMRNAC